MFDDLLKERLKEYCGGSCVTAPKNCDCFGELTDDQKNDPYLEYWDVIYKKEQCAFYDAMSFQLKQELSQSEATH